MTKNFSIRAILSITTGRDLDPRPLELLDLFEHLAGFSPMNIERPIWRHRCAKAILAQHPNKPALARPYQGMTLDDIERFVTGIERELGVTELPIAPMTDAPSSIDRSKAIYDLLAQSSAEIVEIPIDGGLAKIIKVGDRVKHGEIKQWGKVLQVVPQPDGTAELEIEREADHQSHYHGKGWWATYHISEHEPA